MARFIVAVLQTVTIFLLIHYLTLNFTPTKLISATLSGFPLYFIFFLIDGFPGGIIAIQIWIACIYIALVIFAPEWAVELFVAGVLVAWSRVFVHAAGYIAETNERIEKYIETIREYDAAQTDAEKKAKFYEEADEQINEIKARVKRAAWWGLWKNKEVQTLNETNALLREKNAMLREAVGRFVALNKKVAREEAPKSALVQLNRTMAEKYKSKFRKDERTD